MPIQHGIDIVSVSRVEEIIRRQGARFLKRVFTPRERTYCDSKRRKYEHYAARFAAKEAVIKALEGRGDYLEQFREIEICRRPTGKPYVRLSPKLRRLCGIPRNSQMELSMAHERDVAVASFILVVP